MKIVMLVSRVPYPKLAEMLRSRRSYRNFVNIIFLLMLLLAVHELAIPLAMLYFVAAAPLVTFWNRVVLRRPDVFRTTQTRT